MDTRERSEVKEHRGYKRNRAKWVGLYLLIGGIAYLLVYLFAFHHGGGGGLGY